VHYSVAADTLLTPKAAIKNKAELVEYQSNYIQVWHIAAAAMPRQLRSQNSKVPEQLQEESLK
jgi:hypothetical protein